MVLLRDSLMQLKISNQLRLSDQTLGEDLTSFNNLKTRSFAPGEDNIENMIAVSTGVDPTDDAVFRAVVTLPNSATPNDAMLWEAGGTARSTFLWRMVGYP